MIEPVGFYIAPDGAGKLSKDDNAYIDGQATCGNQNGILCLDYLARACGPMERIFVDAAIKHEKIVKVGKGRYLRRKGDLLRQSHDNVRGWAWISMMYPELKFVAKDIYDFAKWRFFVYDPRHWFSLDPRCWLQPSQVFVLALAAGIKPSWIQTLWFCGNCLVSDHAAGPYMLSLIDTDVVQNKWESLSELKKKIVWWAMGLMIKRREKMGRWYSEFYQDQNNPSVVAQIKADLS